MKLRMFTYLDVLSQEVQFVLSSDVDGGRDVAEPLVMKFIRRGGAVVPTFAIDAEEAREFLRSVMDEAWKLGIRPTDYDNDLGATRKHLEDMRRISFKKLGIGE